MKIQIYIATHKQYQMPATKIYQPIFVGTNLNGRTPINYQPDNTGDNISSKNPNFNELTALYWIWKNCHADIKGLDQYRRYLSSQPHKKLLGLLSASEIETLLLQHDVIVPKKRRYYIETNYSHYVHAHHQAPLDMMRRVVEEKYPAYEKDFDTVMYRTSAHMFNMMIMRDNQFNAYAEWLFSILFEIEQRIDISNYDSREARVFGYLSELLLDVWIEHNHLTFAEVPVMYMENQKILQKAYNLLKRKFFPRAVKQTHF
ncbi:DUF4422 domain-containing protein [Lactiplantibacillus carotarum]|uniref:DUF4422 domain-containing protein n=1 Tax=Lactiplantibacillus carotarum TaxID=2993456 RepID=UPI00298F09B5|nr:DUF4422 domain-containing protein [Lactiplantibacillus carotarum]